MVYPLVPLYLVGMLGAPRLLWGLLKVLPKVWRVFEVFSGAASDKVQKRKPNKIKKQCFSGNEV
jgi:hypothetical protein